MDSAPLALAKLAGWGVAVMLVTRTLVAQPFNVPSASMYPTLEIGDVILATKFSYGYSSASMPLGGVAKPGSGRLLGSVPARGDVVVFRWTGNPSRTWVKRVVGVPGDVVSVQGGIPTIEGLGATVMGSTTEAAHCGEDSCRAFAETLPGGSQHLVEFDATRPANRDAAAVRVPPDMLFVMGDNRDDSADSRVPVANGGAGLVSVESVEGRVVATVAGFDLDHDPPIPGVPMVRWARVFRRVR